MKQINVKEPVRTSRLYKIGISYSDTDGHIISLRNVAISLQQASDSYAVGFRALRNYVRTSKP